jgi:hypothetical protein
LPQGHRRLETPASEVELGDLPEREEAEAAALHPKAI